MSRLLSILMAAGVPLLVLLLVAPVSPAWAEDSKPDDHLVPHTAAPDDFSSYVKEVWAREKLMGDWRGLRTDMGDHGLTVDLTLSQFYQGVATGGVRTHAEYGGKMDYRITIDANKLMGTWKGLFASVHLEQQWGNGLIEDSGSLVLENTAMLYPAPNKDGIEMTGFLLEQYLSKNIVVFAGKLHAFDLWTGIEPDTGYGLEGFMNAQVLAAAMPWLRSVNLAMWGGGGWTLTDEGQIQAALLIFDTNSAAATNDLNDVFEDGVAFLGLYRFFYDVFDKPGYLMLVVGGSTAQYVSLDDHDFSVIPGEGLSNDNQRGQATGAFYLKQVFWEAEDNKDRKAWIYVAGSYGDDNPSFSQWTYFFSLNSVGLISRRPKDRMGASFYQTGLTHDVKQLTQTAGIGLRNMWGLEFFYNVEINPWMHLTGDLQIVKNENQGDDTAVIPGLRLVMDF